MLVIDDAQHADEGLLQFLEHLLGRAAVPVLRRAADPARAARGAPDAGRRTAGRPSCTWSRCRPATWRRCSTGWSPGCPTSVRDQLVARVRGRPAVRRRDGALADRPRPRRAARRPVRPRRRCRPSTWAIGAPASLQALVAARLDACRRTSGASSTGPACWASRSPATRVAALCPDVADLDAVLAEPGAPADPRPGDPTGFSAELGQYRFVQSVVRQVAYARLSRRDRKALHLAVARADSSAGAEHDDLAPSSPSTTSTPSTRCRATPTPTSCAAAAVSHLERAAARPPGSGRRTRRRPTCAVALPHAATPGALAIAGGRRSPGRCSTPAATTRRAGTPSRPSSCWSRPGTGSAPPWSPSRGRARSAWGSGDNEGAEAAVAAAVGGAEGPHRRAPRPGTSCVPPWWTRWADVASTTCRCWTRDSGWPSAAVTRGCCRRRTPRSASTTAARVRCTSAGCCCRRRRTSRGRTTTRSRCRAP